MTSTQSEVRALLDSRTEAMRAKDLDHLMSLYAPDIVYFDLVPPLHYTGSAALRARFTDWFEGWDGPIGMEIDHVHISASTDIATAHMLIHTSGTRKNGRKVNYWVRTTNSFQHSNHQWLITHEHVSLPVDIASGHAVLDLVP